MNRVNLGVLAVFAVGFGLVASAGPNAAFASQGNIGTYVNAAPTQVAQSGGLPPADYGSPPSGEYPILFNDRHVYAKPDELKQNRVLAALVRGSTVLVPLRSLFEQMGATVSYDPESKTVDVSKPGSDIKVTVGQAEVVINGESRPLDVPPEIYKGTVLVPVRVISEGMGAYVQWVPAKKTVVVRYVPPPPPPPPTPAPTKPPAPKPPPPKPAPTKPPAPKPAPTPVPLPSEEPTPTVTYDDEFIVADYQVTLAFVNNEFSGGAKRRACSRLAVPESKCRSARLTVMGEVRLAPPAVGSAHRLTSAVPAGRPISFAPTSPNGHHRMRDDPGRWVRHAVYAPGLHRERNTDFDVDGSPGIRVRSNRCGLYIAGQLSSGSGTTTVTRTWELVPASALRLHCSEPRPPGLAGTVATTTIRRFRERTACVHGRRGQRIPVLTLSYGVQR